MICTNIYVLLSYDLSKLMFQVYVFTASALPKFSYSFISVCDFRSECRNKLTWQIVITFISTRLQTIMWKLINLIEDIYTFESQKMNKNHAINSNKKFFWQRLNVKRKTLLWLLLIWHLAAFYLCLCLHYYKLKCLFLSAI